MGAAHQDTCSSTCLLLLSGFCLFLPYARQMADPLAREPDAPGLFFPKARGAHPALLLLLPARQPAVSRAARAVRPVRRLPAGSFRTPDLHAHPVAAELHRHEVPRRALDAQRRGAVLPDFPAAPPACSGASRCSAGPCSLRWRSSMHRAVLRARPAAAPTRCTSTSSRPCSAYTQTACSPAIVLVPPAQRPAEAPRAHAARRDAALRGLPSPPSSACCTTGSTARRPSSAGQVDYRFLFSAFVSVFILSLGPLLPRGAMALCKPRRRLHRADLVQPVHLAHDDPAAVQGLASAALPPTRRRTPTRGRSRPTARPWHFAWQVQYTVLFWVASLVVAALATYLIEKARRQMAPAGGAEKEKTQKQSARHEAPVDCFYSFCSFVFSARRSKRLMAQRMPLIDDREMLWSRPTPKTVSSPQLSSI